MNRLAKPFAQAAIVVLGLSEPAQAQHAEMPKHGEAPPLVWGLGAEVGAVPVSGGVLTEWDAHAWAGNDALRARLESEGEVHRDDVEEAELRALASVPIAEYWDAQAGIRQDLMPGRFTWGMLGLSGLAPYHIETEARLFLGEDGTVALRTQIGTEIPITQRLFLEPSLELNAYSRDVREIGVRAGLADLEAALQLRYELHRKVAPYVELHFEQKVGETAQLAENRRENPSDLTLRVGLRLKF